MSKTYRNTGILLAVVCGVLTSYSAFRPELEEQKAERLGLNRLSEEQKQAQGGVLSEQMRQDFREAGRELEGEEGKGGFAWGIRRALFGGRKTAVEKEEGISKQALSEKERSGEQKFREKG